MNFLFNITSHYDVTFSLINKGFEFIAPQMRGLPPFSAIEKFLPLKKHSISLIDLKNLIFSWAIILHF